MYPARHGRWAWNGPISTSAFARWASREAERADLSPRFFEPLSPVVEPLAGGAREFDDFDFRMDFAGVLAREIQTERNVGQQIDLVEDHQIRFEKRCRVLQRLVFAFGDAQHSD